MGEKVTKTCEPPKSVPGSSTSERLEGQKLTPPDRDIVITPGNPQTKNVDFEKTLKPTSELYRPHPKALPKEIKSKEGPRSARKS